jgi:hypothetical protein
MYAAHSKDSLWLWLRLLLLLLLLLGAFLRDFIDRYRNITC